MPRQFFLQTVPVQLTMYGMITIQIRVVLPSQEPREVDLPLNTDIDQLYARLVAREGLPTTTANGEPIPYGFYHRRGRRYLPAHVSLIDAGVVNGDIVDVVAWPNLEPPIRALAEAHLYRDHRYVPARWLVTYVLAIIAIISGVVLLAAHQAGQPVTEFVDPAALSALVNPETLTEPTTYMREDSMAGLVVYPGSFNRRTTLAERKVSNPSPGVDGMSEVAGPVFDFIMVTDGAIVEPVVVRLRIPSLEVGAARADHNGSLWSVVRWDERAQRWEPLPTQVGDDGYLYAPTTTLGLFGAARTTEVLLWHGDGNLAVGGIWGLNSPVGAAGQPVEQATTAITDDAGRWLPSAQLDTLAGVLALRPTDVLFQPAAALPRGGDALLADASALLDEEGATAIPYVSPTSRDDVLVAAEGDIKVSDWKSVQVEAPIPYADGPSMTVVTVRCRLLLRGEMHYLEYNAAAPDVAPVDFVWLAYTPANGWTAARVGASELAAGLVALPDMPAHVWLVTHGQPYEAWAVWGADAAAHRVFDVSGASWAGESPVETPATETAEADPTTQAAPAQTREANLPPTRGEAPHASPSLAATVTSLP